MDCKLVAQQQSAEVNLDLISPTQAGTLYGLLSERARRTPESTAYSEYDWDQGRWLDLSWRDILNRADSLADALNSTELVPGDRVGLLLKNSTDWVCFDMAAQKLGLIVVPLYSHDSPSNSAHILQDSEARLLLIDTIAMWLDIESTLGDAHVLETIWVREQWDAVPVRRSTRQVLSLDTVLSESFPKADEAGCDPSDVATFIYTSGTTGTPKGVMLSHSAILKNAEAVGSVFPPTREDVFLSILPLAHAFERTMGYYLPMMGGSRVVYARSLLRFRDDLRNIMPTVLMGVPRLYQQIYASIWHQVRNKPIHQALLKHAARIGLRCLQHSRGTGECSSLLERMVWPLLSRFVAEPVARALGGRLRVAVSGGADLPVEVSAFLLGLGVPLVEGYGLTEAGPVVTGTSIVDYSPGSVGRALPGVDLKITEHGELLVNSPSCMTGYWRREAANAEVKTPDGWLRTGDLAVIRDGRVILTGRLKDVLVLSNGENVNPAPIEARIEADPLFDQVCLVGDGKPFVSALVVLNSDAWKGMASQWGADTGNPNGRPAQERILDTIKNRLSDLPAHQRVRAVHVEIEPWTIERGLLTPTLKVRRKNVISEFDRVIRNIYGDSR